MNEASVRRSAEAAAKAIREDWGSLTWLTGKLVGNSEHLTVGRVVINPGMSNPKHLHNGCEEVLYLLTGRLEHTIGDKVLILEPGDTLVVPKGMPHNAVNISGVPADMIVTYDTGSRDFVRT